MFLDCVAYICLFVTERWANSECGKPTIKAEEVVGSAIPNRNDR